MAKFVTFEDCIRQTMEKSYTDRHSKAKGDEINGYKFVCPNRIVKVSDYQWNEADWERCLSLMSEYRIKGHLDKHRCLIMAAWNQVKGRQPRPELL